MHVAIFLTKVDRPQQSSAPKRLLFRLSQEEHLKAVRNKRHYWVQTSDLDQSWQCHCIWTFECLLYGLSFLISMFKISMMLSQNVVGAIFETWAHMSFSPVLWTTRCHVISDVVLSLANALNKRGSYLVTDQTAAACRGLGQASSPHVRILSQQNCLSLLINFPLSSLLFSFLFSLAVMVTSLKKKFAALPRRPMISVPQSSPRLCAVFSKLAFSLSAVKLSGTLYFFIASAGLFL